MATIEDADQDIPEMAVNGLSAAHAKARRSGRSLVYVEDSKLVKLLPDGSKVELKSLPALTRVSQRTKKARP